jgi:nucleoside-diphosphate-sugar epimerase
MSASPLAGRTALVTGGAGFIGSHLVAALVRAGARARVLDDFSTGREENLAALGDLGDALVWHRGDVRSQADCAQACAGVDVVFHLAALVSVPGSFTEPLECVARNLVGTARIFDAARAAGVRRVVNASSSAVYGDATAVPSREGREGRALSPYAETKRTVERLSHALWRAHRQEVVSLRFFNVYGARQDPRSPYAAVIARFVAAARAGEAATIHGDGEQTRDFVHVDDAVAACLAAAVAPSAACGEAFNVGTGVATSIRALVERVRELYGGPPPRFAAPREGEVRHSLAATESSLETLGFRARRTLVEGLALL